MSQQGLRRYLFETKAIVSGGKVQLTAKELPKGMALHRIEVVADCVFTQGAGPAEVKGRDMLRIVKELRLSKRHIMQGNQIAWQNFLVRGRRETPAAFTGVAANVFNRKVRWVVDFTDIRAKRPEAACPLTDFLVDDPLSISFESIGVAGATVGPTTTFTGTIYAIAYVKEPDPGRLPSILAHEYVQWVGQRIVLDSKARTIVDMFLYKEDGSPFTAAEVATVSASVDGVPYDSLPGIPADLTFAYNQERAAGGDLENDVTATPVSAERLNDQPGAGAGATGAIAPEIIPIFFGRDGHKLLDDVQADKQTVLSLTGTLTSFSVGVRYVEHRSEDQRQKGARVAGHSGGAFQVRDDDGRLTGSARASAIMPLDTPAPAK